MSAMEKMLRNTKSAWKDHLARVHDALSMQCETFDVDSVLKVSFKTIDNEQVLSL